MIRSVTAIAPWYGSQAGVQDWIVPQLGDYRGLYDVCCGGCSMLLACQPVPFEVINDLHGGLVNLCRVLASHRYGMLKSQLERTLASEAIFDEAAAWVADHKDDRAVVAPSVLDVTGEHVQAAMYQFVVWWMGCGGMAGSNAKPRMSKRWGPGGGLCCTRFAQAVASVDAFHTRLRKVDIRCGDLFELLAKIKDEPGVTVYIDPPWRVGGSAYEYNWHEKPEPGVGGLFASAPGTGAGAEAKDTEQFYVDLHRAVSRFKRARVVIRHEEDAFVEKLFAAYDWFRLRRTRNKGLTSAAGVEGGGRMDEMLILNQPPAAVGGAA